MITLAEAHPQTIKHTHSRRFQKEARADILGREVRLRWRWFARAAPDRWFAGEVGALAVMFDWSRRRSTTSFHFSGQASTGNIKGPIVRAMIFGFRTDAICRGSDPSGL
ncbi:hypothetical protein OROGR_019021 [Orobanche gracilis]